MSMCIPDDVAPYRDQMVVFYSRQRNRSGGVGLRECCVHEDHFEITCSVGVVPC